MTDERLRRDRRDWSVFLTRFRPICLLFFFTTACRLLRSCLFFFLSKSCLFCWFVSSACGLLIGLVNCFFFCYWTLLLFIFFSSASPIIDHVVRPPARTTLPLLQETGLAGPMERNKPKGAGRSPWNESDRKKEARRTAIIHH